MEDEHERRSRLLHRRHQEQLAPDLELEDERVARIELDDEVLGPAPRPRYPHTIETSDELPGRGLFYERAVQDSRGLDPRAHDELAQILPYGLHLGELRHASILSSRRRRRSRRSGPAPRRPPCRGRRA